ncbi:hypothetical protein [Lentzea sp. NPDC051838]|uniref:hypothetical protein n=1 Tax=Lentzea sp. NPDC051838 TaxID=3154849 RepID=UPI00341E19C8
MSDSSRLTVCRGCCCGTEKKHPGFDHEGQLRALREAVGEKQVQVADCLDSCDFSNVVVVRPSPSARADGARPVWFGGVLGDEATRHVVEWVAAGGPGRVAVPDELADKVLDRTKSDDDELAS